MYIVIRWLIIFSIIAIWFAVGIRICKSNSNTKKMKLANARELERCELERTQQFETFIHSEGYKKIMNLEPIEYFHEPHDSDCGGEE